MLFRSGTSGSAFRRSLANTAIGLTRPPSISALLSEVQLELYQRVRSLDAENAGASAGLQRISRARGERARALGGLVETHDASPAGLRPKPMVAEKIARVETASPEIEVRDPAADAALRKARAAGEAQMAAVVSERDRLLAEVSVTRSEHYRLAGLLETAAQERARLSADLEIARASLPGPEPAGPPQVRAVDPADRARARRRLRRIALGVALAGGASVVGYVTRPARLEVNGSALTLLDRTETAQVSATQILRLGVRRPAGSVAWSSADPRVATVDARGVVTPAGTGRTRIEATEGALASSLEVTVSLPARLVVDPAELTLTPEIPEAAVRASVLDASGAPWKKDAELAWTSSAAGVATFADGKVHRRGPGDAVLTASLGALSGRLVVRSLGRRAAFEQACDAGGLEACVKLGHLVDRGDEGPADSARALVLHERACQAGALTGCVAAGELEESGRAGTPDVKKTLAEYQKACDGKASPGCSRLGRLYEATIRDLGKALLSYRAACDALDLEGCWRLGTLHELGSGVARDPAIAVDLYTRACDGGRPQACTSLAHMYWNGSGSVARDLPGALVLFEKACDGRHDEACIFLALKYKAGEGVPADPRRALGFFGKACEAGHKGSCVIAPRAGER